MSDEWGPWRSDVDPEIGMYVQLITENNENRERRIYEGIVAYSDDEFLNLSPSLDTDAYDWTLIEWRERKPKGLQILQDILREVEDDGGVGYKEREKEEVR